MVFSSTIFLFLFFPILLIIYFNPLFTSRAFRNYTLLFFSLFFYAWGEPIYIFYFLAVITVNWALCLLMVKYTRFRTWFFILAVLFDLGFLFYFKYYMFFRENLTWLLNLPELKRTIVLPLGISFFVFQIVSYIADVYNHNAGVQKSWKNVALYILMFPQLIAGPIVRYQTIADEIKVRKETFSDFTDGMMIFARGLIYKVIFANNLALLADAIFNGNLNHLR